MLKDKYIRRIKEIVFSRLQEKEVQVFIFGSAVSREDFADVDIGVMGEADEDSIRRIKEDLEDSHLPFFFDVVQLDRTSEEFKNNVLNQKILWLEPSS